MMEHDIWIYLRLRLSDLFRENPPYTLRELLVYLKFLPEESMLSKSARNDPLTTDQHIMLSLLDSMNANAFDSKVAAIGLIGKEYRKVAKEAPKMIPRPELKPVKQEKKFLSASDLKKMLEQKKRVVHHTPECIASEINKGGGRVNCNCQ